jgi:hypothetical protein
MLKKACLISIPMVLLGAYLAFSYFDRERNPPPVPPDVAFAEPDASLPAAVRSLVGKWVGNWNAQWGWDTALYIEKVEKDSAQVVYAWGDYYTHMGSCHCQPNWVRVRKAKITVADGKTIVDFYTPKLRPGWIRKSHTVSGGADEIRQPHEKSSGRYTYQFIIEKDNPDVLKGTFVSAKASLLSIRMKRAAPEKEPDKKTEERK